MCRTSRSPASCSKTSLRCSRIPPRSSPRPSCSPSTARRLKCDAVLAIESRGFILGAPLAQRLGLPLQLVRKRGKLPRAALTVSYELEYGVDHLEVHEDAITQGRPLSDRRRRHRHRRNGGRGRELGRAAGRDRRGVPVPRRAHVPRGPRQARRRRRLQPHRAVHRCARSDPERESCDARAQCERFRMNSESHSRPSARGPSVRKAPTARACVSAARCRAPSTPSVEG